MDTSFTDSNTSSSAIRSGVRPRWERKKQHTQQQKQQQLLAVVASENRPPLSGSNAGSAAVGGGGDRFIPNRAGMNMELSKHLIRNASNSSMDSTNSISDHQTAIDTSFDYDQKTVSDAKKGQYNSNLSSAIFGVDDLTSSKGNRVISYQEKAPAPKGDTVSNLNILYSASASSCNQRGSSNTKLVARQIPSAPSRILDAPDLMDDYYLNLVSWSDTNVLAIALSQTVYLWNAGTGDIQELCTFEDDSGSVGAHISSVSWVQEGGEHIAVGTSSGKTQLWDVNECKQIRSMDGHTDRVSSLAWNSHLLSSGSRDTNIVQHDVRIARHNVATLTSHTQEVCGLAWSPDGTTLASGGNDNLLCLWDVSATASGNISPAFCFADHQAAVKALAWSPHERNLLASGGGTADRTIKFWNSKSGALLNSIDTGSQVCALQWNPFEKEILSSHGFAQNQLCLWKYPSMSKIKELEGHTSRVLHMAVSPYGGTVVSAAGDETLRFWNVFAPPPVTKKKASSVFSLPGGAKSRWTTTIR